MANKRASTRRTPPQRTSYISRLFRGQVISSDFFARHWLSVVILVIVLMVYITTKFTYRSNLETIEGLQKQLEIVQNESQRERSRFRSRIRETSMQQMVDSLHLNLRVQPQPPYKIKL